VLGLAWPPGPGIAIIGCPLNNLLLA
jgi:hypothetical protein